MNQVRKIIQQLGQERGFVEVVLTDAVGFPLAALASGAEAEAPAAIAAFVQRMAEQARGRVGLGVMDEVTMYDEAGQRLVCRQFVAGEHTLILAAKIAPRTPYRRATNRAIRQIQRVWTFGQPAR